MLPDTRGLLQALSGASRAQSYGMSLDYRLGRGMMLIASAYKEQIVAPDAAVSFGNRQKFSIGISRKTLSNNMRLQLNRQDIARFSPSGIAFRPGWSLEANAEHRLTSPAGAPDFMLRMQARTGSDGGFDDAARTDATRFSSQDMQAQLKVGLLARW